MISSQSMHFTVIKKKTSLYLKISESPDFGTHFQRMELCMIVMALQDKLQNETKEGNPPKNFTLLLHFTTDKYLIAKLLYT